jgi:hypothetical protein
MYQKPSVLFNPIIPHVQGYQLATNVPGGGSNCLRKTEIGILEERELKVVVLADRHQRSCGIETLQMSEYQHCERQAELGGRTSARRKKETR